MRLGKGLGVRLGKRLGVSFMRSKIAAASALAITLTLAPALAQQPAAPVQLETAPPYERQLLRLSEILGALEWLTNVCGEDSATMIRGQWRARMLALIETEGATPQRRERLAGGYNRGYRGYEATYRTCTPNARLVIGRFLDEGGRIARDVGNQYSE